jgi:hypothetical protein
MCSVLVPNTSADSSTRQEICNQFLREFPFNTTKGPKKSTESETPATISTKPVLGENNFEKLPIADPHENLSDTETEIIQQKLKSVLGDGSDQAAYISKIVDIYRFDLSKIAYLNQFLSIQLQPQLNYESLQYNYHCLYLQQLTKLLAYRPTDYRFCQITSEEIALPSGQHSSEQVPIVFVSNAPPTGSLVRKTQGGEEAKIGDKSESAAETNQGQEGSGNAGHEQHAPSGGGPVAGPVVEPPRHRARLQARKPHPLCPLVRTLEEGPCRFLLPSVPGPLTNSK